MAEGGYLIQEVTIYERPGFIGWLCRLLHLKYGWIESHPYKDIMAHFDKFKRDVGEDGLLGIYDYVSRLRVLIKDQHIDSDGSEGI